MLEFFLVVGCGALLLHHEYKADIKRMKKRDRHLKQQSYRFHKKCGK